MSSEREVVEELTAESIVDEALQGYEHTVPAERLAELRTFLIAKLIATRGGQERLRRLRPDPEVNESGETGTAEALKAPGKQGGGAA